MALSKSSLGWGRDLVEGGKRGLYKGFLGCQVLRVADITLRAKFANLFMGLLGSPTDLAKFDTKDAQIQSFYIASLASLGSSVFIYPFWLIKTRVLSDVGQTGQEYYSSFRSAFSKG